MSIDQMITDFNSLDVEGQRKKIQSLSDHAIDLECEDREDEALKIHECIANSKIQLSEDDLGLDESALINELENLDPNKDLSGTALGGMLESLMDSSSDLVNMSREYCEDAGISCPPSYSKQHEIDCEARSDEDRVSSHLVNVMKEIGVDSHTISTLYPYYHEDSDWEVVLNCAFDDNEDPEKYMEILNYIKERSLCEEDELDYYPKSKDDFVAKKSRMAMAKERVSEFLNSNCEVAEKALTKLIDRAKAIGATRAMLTDHPDYGLELGVCEHDGKGDLGRVKLVKDFHDWVGGQLEDEEDDEGYWLDSSETWPWIRDRWISVGGDASGIKVVIFANGLGDTYDLTTGEEDDSEDFM